MKATILVMAALLGVSAMGETIELKSGSTLKGKVTAVSRDEITFDSEDFGEVKIKVEKIAKLGDQGEHVVQYNDNSTEGKKLSIEDGAYLADGDVLKMDDVKKIDPEAETWHGDIHLGFMAARGNTYENTASLTAKLNRRWEHDRLRFEAGYYNSRTGSDGDTRTTTDRWEIFGQEDHFWSKALYNFVNLKYESDRVADLKARYRAGLGLGYQWLDGYVQEDVGKWDFNQELGVDYVKEEYDGNNEDTKKNGFAALHYAHHLKFVPKSIDGLEAFHNLEYLPEIDEWEKYLVKTDIGFTMKLYGDFDFLAKIELDYNSKPASNRKKDDVRYILGLGYKW